MRTPLSGLLSLLVTLSLAVPLRAEDHLQVLVLDFAAGSVDEETVTAAGELVTAELVRRPGLQVTSGEDLRRALALESDKAQVGCDQEGCAAEIAGALGAELVVFGRASRLGSIQVIHLSLYDSVQSRTVARSSLQFERPESLLEHTGRAVAALVDDELAARRSHRRGSSGAADPRWSGLPPTPVALLLASGGVVLAGVVLAVLAVGGGGAFGFSQSAALAAAEATYRSPAATSADERAALNAAAASRLWLSLTPWAAGLGVALAVSLGLGGATTGAGAGLLVFDALSE